MNTEAAPLPAATVTLGTAHVSFPAANQYVINQTSQKAVISWSTFSIAAGGSATFNQPNSASITVNKVRDIKPSIIAGTINANGQVWILNANGVLFGRGAQVNVAGLLATTADISNTDFQNGNYNFIGGTNASVVNQGTIKVVAGGSVVLSAARVSNEGLIEADAGSVVLGGASAFTIDLDGDNLLRYAITAPAGQASDGTTGVSNSGSIIANGGGKVLLTARAAKAVVDSVVNNTGMISATSAKVENGEVIFDAGDGSASVSGTVTATGSDLGTTGGSVQITGKTVTVADNATIDASGDAGGGTISIGGSAHGAGPLPNADTTTVGRATIRTNAGSSGNGGTLVVWSNGLTDFSAIVSVIGGAAGGSGGMVETSGATVHISGSASVNASAPNGSTGTWLVDPTNLTVGTDVDPAALTKSILTSNVVLAADNDLNVASPLAYNSANSLSLLAGHDVSVVASVQNGGTGGLTAIAGWDKTTIDPTQFTNAGVFGNNGGTITIGGNAATAAVSFGAATGATTVAARTISVTGTNGAAQIGFAGAGGGGIIVVDALGSVSLSGTPGASAEIGQGAVFASNAQGGSVYVTAQAITATDASAVVADNLIITLTGGGSSNVGSASAPVSAATNTLTVQGQGANAYFAMNSGVDIAKVDLGTGSFNLSVGGTITQTGAITANRVTVNASAGGIVLSNGANSFAQLSATAAGDIYMADSTGVTIANASAGGIFSLSAGGPVGQTGAITASLLHVATAAGDIVLTNAANSFVQLSASAPGNISVGDSTGFTIASASAGGAVSLSAGGSVSQTGAITALAADIVTSAGDIGLTNAANKFGQLNVSAPGNINVNDSAEVIVAKASAGGVFNLAAGGTVGQTGAITASAVNITTTAGDLVLTNPANSFAQLSATAPGSISVTDLTGLMVASAAAGGTLELSAGGSISQTGAITASGLNVTTTAGGLLLTNSANAFATLRVHTPGNATLTDNAALTIAGATVGGALAVTAHGAVAQSGAINASTLSVSANGSIAFTDLANAVSGVVAFQSNGPVTFYNTIATTLGASTATGNVVVLSKGNVVVQGSLQDDAGDVTIVAGWDGTTTDPSALLDSGAYGNAGGSVTIGGAGAASNVALGSHSGLTTIAAANLTLAAVNGYAELGYYGGGSGALKVVATNAVALMAGAGIGQFSQIGNGGRSSEGNNSGGISITAGGDVTLDGGAGSAAYAQIGHGGGQSNINSAGYSNTGAVIVTGADVLLTAGTGDGAYVQIGHGGYLAGSGLSGFGTNAGSISVTAAHDVTLLGGGKDAYAQIGNGGSQNNLNPTATAGGSDAGDVVVTAPNGPSGSVSLTAGAGANAYAQIGNGGYSVNAGASAVTANFAISGNITVTDLLLEGGDFGPNAYAQIGNGDASHHSVGNVSGNVQIDANGNITYIPGTAPGSSALIGDFTGTGTVNGIVTGTGIPPDVTSTVVYLENLDSIVTAKNVTFDVAAATFLYDYATNPATATSVVFTPGPIEELTDEGSPERVGLAASDNVAQVIADSLDGAHKPSRFTVIIPHLLTQVVGGINERTRNNGDIAVSSWGNDAFWQ